MKRLFIILFLLTGVFAYSQPSPPILISPNGSVCPGDVLLDWTDVIGAYSYRVQVFQGATTILDVSGITVSQYLVLAVVLQSNTQYYWRANATGPSGTSQWSSQMVFFIQYLPNPPGLLMPPNNATNVSVNTTFDWNGASGATYYVFQLSKSLLFDSLVINDTTPLPPITLQYNTQYYWRMKSGNGCGTSNWTPVWTFRTVQTQLTPPILICDTANVPLNPTLDWYDVPAAITYRIQISTLPTFASVIINTVVTVSQYTVPSGALSYCTHFYWRVNATNTGGTSPWSTICSFTTITQSGIRNVSSEVPTENKLYSNYPNPFNPITNVQFSMCNAGNVKLVVYDIQGREVQTLVNEYMKPGTYEATFDGSQLTSGVYFYRISTGDFTETRKMLLLK